MVGGRPEVSGRWGAERAMDAALGAIESERKRVIVVLGLIPQVAWPGKASR